ncbi:AMP-binding protein [Yinghuangia sp. ASG 101]|uniref:class I adenylate-forming enzyme family protein n=1 Tax=Yinghuangia sp. ASG 101 TaxID=2896848 RepID=UPI001E57AE1D|nr:AMP-binding protein [Yinghuangia sp. ASG 101]UGQ11942.1 AMP-binding protein [Yinghuangia sp. ASG 101]
MENTGSPESYSRRVARLAEERPTDIALTFGLIDGDDVSFTWAETHGRACRLAAAFAARGLRHAGRLSLSLRNTPEFVFSALAAYKLGAVPVPVRWDLPEWELSRVQRVVDAELHVGPADLPWLRATADDPEPDLPDALSPQVFGICSSGSTGSPKVIVTERPAVFEEFRATPFAQLWQPIPRPETILVLAPMYHTNGFSTLVNLLGGDRLVIMEKFDAARVVDLIERHRVTTFTATPTMLQRIADLPDIGSRDLSSLQWFLQGAAPMPPSLVRRWAELIGPERIFMAYGMTEGFGLTALRGDEWLTHEGSVGRGFQDTEIRILDADGKPVPTGETGSVYLRTPHGGSYTYLGSDQRAAATDDGFQTAGDMGYLDDEGYLYLRDRAVDLIITGGANVFPAEVEHALIDHPGIADVVVIGLRDPEWGRRVHAVIEPVDHDAPPTAEEVIAFAKSRLAAYKVPKTVECVAAMPRSAATKVSRGAMVEARGG